MRHLGVSLAAACSLAASTQGEVMTHLSQSEITRLKTELRDELVESLMARFDNRFQHLEKMFSEMESRLLVSLNRPGIVQSPVTGTEGALNASAVQPSAKPITKPNRQSRMRDEEVQKLTRLSDLDMERMKVSIS